MNATLGLSALFSVGLAAWIWKKAPRNDPEPANLVAVACGLIAGLGLAAVTGLIAAGPVLTAGVPAAWIDSRHQRLPWWLSEPLLLMLPVVIACEAWLTDLDWLAALAQASAIAAMYVAMNVVGLVGRGDAYWAVPLGWLAASTAGSWWVVFAFFVTAAGSTIAWIVGTNRFRGVKAKHAAGPGMVLAGATAKWVTPMMLWALGA